MKTIFNKFKSFFVYKTKCNAENENLPITVLINALRSEVKRSKRLNPELSSSELYMVGLLEHRRQLKVNNFV